ncbi:GTP pyrophosphokinase [Fervidibacillus albus]|uniref:GTP pyrophosphokinase family protein n=1 Tax=Fervidibacillus albus TaxID=2980026 RepID=A0A9E8LUW4_9BACI|nr:GTP pyrophosphokinase family protein [Fervidibacillus albus]WAA10118.1 GTP pyrophosphokinase family protein [Fervidibacillus albus]
MALNFSQDEIKEKKTEFLRFLLSYKFALEEVNTKINILMEEFQYIHDYNPIEHVKSRLKKPESILKKMKRKGCSMSIEEIRENIRDIAGIRITCSYTSDIYKVSEMLQKQKDITVIEVKDYIRHPKPNGYRSLHLIIQIPIFMSDREEHVYVELQIRTIAMDFWASLEHKIFYKYNQDIPEHIKIGLKEAADTANHLDEKMEKLQQEMHEIKEKNAVDEDFEKLLSENHDWKGAYGLLFD